MVHTVKVLGWHYALWIHVRLTDLRNVKSSLKIKNMKIIPSYFKYHLDDNSKTANSGEGS